MTKLYLLFASPFLHPPFTCHFKQTRNNPHPPQRHLSLNRLVYNATRTTPGHFSPPVDRHFEIDGNNHAPGNSTFPCRYVVGGTEEVMPQLWVLCGTEFGGESDNCAAYSGFRMEYKLVCI